MGFLIEILFSLRRVILIIMKNISGKAEKHCILAPKNKRAEKKGSKSFLKVMAFMLAQRYSIDEMKRSNPVIIILSPYKLLNHTR
ncbi:hypothetical protein GCM10008905_25550 [Clostridium malenominatum]|uniref:Transposase n=1 Tax=Clostridium malenominatum TaxID=1539 RepID=A0ABN1J3I1_9CLOT